VGFFDFSLSIEKSVTAFAILSSLILRFKISPVLFPKKQLNFKKQLYTFRKNNCKDARIFNYFLTHENKKYISISLTVAGLTL
jgi:hypothetical protein